MHTVPPPRPVADADAPPTSGRRPGPARTPPASRGRVAARAAAYFVVTWGLLLALAATAGPLVLLAALGVAAYTMLPIVAFARRGGSWRRYPTAGFRLGVVRPALYAQLLLPVVAAAGALGVLGGLAAGHAAAAGRWAALAALGAGLAAFLAGWLGSRRLVVREVEARVPGLPAAFDGLRIVQLSDLHMGPQTSRHFLARAVRAAAALRPDLVVLTGDLVDDRAEDAAGFAAWVEELDDATRASLGVVLIPGNHDVYAGWPAVARALRRGTRARVLVNDAHVLRREGAALALVGTGDPAGGRASGPASADPDERPGPDLDRAFARVPAGVPVVAFAHNPVLWPPLARRGVAVTLSGHTHWGQFALPRRGWSLASPFLEHAMGGYQDGDALLYVHPGTGFWGIPFRLGAYPEVAAVTLRAAADGPAALEVGVARRAA
jgi:predicted MPP superfamily phosphohydrolase